MERGEYSKLNEIRGIVKELQQHLPTLKYLVRKYEPQQTQQQRAKYQKAKSFYDLVRDEARLRRLPKATLEGHQKMIKQILFNLRHEANEVSSTVPPTHFKVEVLPLKIEPGVFDKDENIFQRRPQKPLKTPEISETIAISDDDDDDHGTTANRTDSNNDCIVIDDSDEAERSQKTIIFNEAKSKLNALMAKLNCQHDARKSAELTNKGREISAAEKTVCDLAQQIAYTSEQPSVSRNAPPFIDIVTRPESSLENCSPTNRGKFTLDAEKTNPPSTSQLTAAEKYANIKNITIKRKLITDYYETGSAANSPKKASDSDKIDLTLESASSSEEREKKEAGNDTDKTVEYDEMMENENSPQSDGDPDDSNVSNRGRLSTGKLTSSTKSVPFSRNNIQSSSSDSDAPLARRDTRKSPKSQPVSNRTRSRSCSRSRPTTPNKSVQNQPGRLHARCKTISINEPPKSRGRPRTRTITETSSAQKNTLQDDRNKRAKSAVRSTRVLDSDLGESESGIGSKTTMPSKPPQVKNSRDLQYLLNDSSFHNKPLRVMERRKSVPANFTLPSDESESESSSSSSTESDAISKSSGKDSNRSKTKRNNAYDIVKGQNPRYPKNIHKEVYASNSKYALQCFVCNKTAKYLVNHYVREHPDSEVYISRLSPPIAVAAKTININQIVNSMNQLVNGFCYFCEQNVKHAESYWPKHVLGHTGEYQHFCVLCKTMCNHDAYHKKCGKIVSIFKYNMTNHGLSGFICNLCNYVQVREKNMISHLEHQHDLSEDGCKQHFQKIMLMRYGTAEEVLPRKTGISAHPVTVKSEIDNHGDDIPIYYIRDNRTTEKVHSAAEPNVSTTPVSNNFEEDIPIEYVGPAGDSTGRSEVSVLDPLEDNTEPIAETPIEDDQSTRSCEEERHAETPLVVKQELIEMDTEQNTNNADQCPSTEPNLNDPSTSNAASNHVVPQITSVETIEHQTFIERLNLPNTVIFNKPLQMNSATAASKRYPRIKYTPTRASTPNSTSELKTVSVIEAISPDIYKNITIKQENKDESALSLDDSTIESLLNLHEIHKKTAANSSKSGQSKINLKSWVSKPRFIRNDSKKMSKIVLYARYKCMSPYCVFATNDESKMLNHLQHHEIYMKFLETALKVQIKDFSWTECAYCDRTFEKNSNDLVRHINEEHGASLFQCSYCYYRTMELDNIASHLAEFHKTSDKIVFLCENEKLDLDKEISKIMESRKSTILPEYPCGLDCSRNKFLLSEHLLHHLSNSAGHKDLFNFRCPTLKCNLLIAKSKADLHFMLHGIYEFHCLYCDIGMVRVQKMRVHMATRHPSKLLYVAARRLRKDQSMDQINPHSFESMIILNISTWHTLYDVCDIKFLRSPFSKDRLNFMKDDLTAFKYNSMDIRENSDSQAISKDELKDIANDCSLQITSGLFVTYENYLASYQSYKVPFEQLELWEKVNGNYDTEKEGKENANEIIDEMGKQIEMSLIKIEPDMSSSFASYSNQSTFNEPSTTTDAPGPHCQLLNSSSSSSLNSVANTHGFMYYCDYCPSKFHSLNGVHRHWMKMHKDVLAANKPINISLLFQFRIEKLYSCPYCNESASYPSIRNHIHTLHTGEKFATLNINNTECGQCSFPFAQAAEDEFLAHYEKEHNAVDGAEIKARYSFITDQFLQELSKVKFEKKLKCGICMNDTFDDEVLLKSHYNERHENENELIMYTESSDTIMYKASCCRYASADEFETLKHIWRHTKRYKCCFCETVCDNITTVQAHQRMIHRSMITMYKDEEIESTMDRYLKIQVIFGNGLVMTKQALEKTRYGSIKGFVSILEELDAVKRSIYQKELNTRFDNGGTLKDGVSDSQMPAESQPLISKRRNRAQRNESCSDSSDELNRSMLWSTRPKRSKYRRSSSPNESTDEQPGQPNTEGFQELRVNLDKSTMKTYLRKK